MEVPAEINNYSVKLALKLQGYEERTSCEYLTLQTKKFQGSYECILFETKYNSMSFYVL